ncbi:MAG: HAD-IIIA family hydrolase [Verrucomicrobia bacterium]|nr:HAD-IIIA family hydrolase [Verrucomicrobiota bacterium]
MSHPAATLRPAVFLDRDGTLMEEVHYCSDPALVRLFPGTAAALRRLVERGYLCVVITNQSGIGRGLLTETQYRAVEAELLRQLGTQEEVYQEIRKSGKEHLELRNSGEEKQTGEPEGFKAKSRGLSEATYRAVEAELLRQLEERRGDAETRRRGENAEPTLSASPRLPISPSSLIAASYFCPEAPPTPSPRRKPEPGMVLEAARDLGIDLARSWFVGDKAADITCGARAGTRTILVQTGYGTQTASQSLDPAPDFIVKDIAAAADVVLQNTDAIRP